VFLKQSPLYTDYLFRTLHLDCSVYLQIHTGNMYIVTNLMFTIFNTWQQATQIFPQLYCSHSTDEAA